MTTEAKREAIAQSPFDTSSGTFDREHSLHCFACGGALGTTTCSCVSYSLGRQALVSAMEWARRDAIMALAEPQVSDEPFGYWVEQRHADPALLRKPAYIPEPNEYRTVTPLFVSRHAAPASEPQALSEERVHEALADFNGGIVHENGINYYRPVEAMRQALIRFATETQKGSGE